MTQHKLAGHSGSLKKSRAGTQGNALPMFGGWKAARPRPEPRFSRPHRGSVVMAEAANRTAFAAEVVKVLGAATATPSPVGLGFRKSEPAGFLPTSVVTGDFNADGKLDFVVSNGGDNTLWLYLGKGDGTFQLPLIIPIAQGQSPVSVATADLRGNGKLDLVVAEADSDSVGIFLGRGDGTFAESSIPVQGAPRSVVVADFNGDGKKDIAVGVDDLTFSVTTYLAVLPGNGAGGFGPALVTANGGGTPRIFFMSAGDLNGDGFPDLLVSSFADTVACQVWANKKDGTFVPGPVLAQTSGANQPLTSVLIDADADGKVDAIVGTGYGFLNLYKGNGDGTFSATPKSFGVGDLPFGLAVADVNGDGHPDLIASGFLGSGGGFGYPAGNLLSVLLGDGTGNFGTAKVYRGDVSAFSLAVGDFNGDGHLDVVTANQDSDSAVVFLNNGSGSYGDPQGEWIGYSQGTVNAPVTDLISADVNGDGYNDLALLEFPSPTSTFYQVTVMLSDKTGHFGRPVRSDAVDGSTQFGDFVLADFRSTGQLDFLAISQDNTHPFVSFAANTGAGSFSSLQTTAPSGADGTLAVGDFNGDGNLDFLAGGPEVGTNAMQVSFFAGQGNGTFQVGPIQAFGGAVAASNVAAIYAGDFNRDGKLDALVFVEQNGGLTQFDDVYELLGNGNGSFQPAKLLFSHFGPMTVVDLDHDGHPDIIQESFGTQVDGSPALAEFSTYLGQSDGTFKLKATYTPYPYSLLLPQFYFAGAHYAPMVADFNGDGNLDIAALQQDASASSTFVQFLLGNGDGTLTPTFTQFDFDKFSYPHLAMDADKDGRADLAELDGLRASYNVLRSGAGPDFQLALAGSPVVGAQGAGLVTLAMPSSGNTSILISASNPNISVPAMVSVPAGQTSQEFHFTVGAGFSRNQVFSIQAQLGSETETAYGYQLAAGAAGFVLRLMPFSEVNLGAGQDSSAIQMFLDSVGGYEAPKLSLSCVGLPVGATCQFAPGSADLVAGGTSSFYFTASVGSGVAIGSYPAKVRATDGILTQDYSFTLNVGDFKIGVAPNLLQMFPNDNANYAITLTSVQKFDQSVNLTMSSAPSGAVGTILLPLLSPTPAGASTGVFFQTQNAPTGNFTLSFAGTSAPLSHSVSAQLQIWDYSGAVSPLTATVKGGASADFRLTLSSINGFSGAVTLLCQSPTGLLGCTFNPPIPTVPAGGSTDVTITLSPSPQLASATEPRNRPGGNWPGPVLGVVALSLISLRRVRFKTADSAGILLTLSFLLSCGGGSGSSGGPPPPPPPKSYVVAIQAAAGSTNKTLGQITLNVTK